MRRGAIKLMGKLYAYLRVSTQTQRIDRQYKNVKEAFPDLLESNIYKEKYTGLKMERPQFSRLCKLVQRGDTIVFDSVSRMSRNAEEGYQQYMDWYTRGITLIFLKEPQINTTAYAELENKQIQIARGSLPDGAIGKLLDGIVEALNDYQREVCKQQIRIAFEQAEKEVEDLHKRVSEGMQRTQDMNRLLPPEKRKQIGRITGEKCETRKSKAAKQIMVAYSKSFEGALSDIDTLALLDGRGHHISRNSYYKYKKELKITNWK